MSKFCYIYLIKTKYESFNKFIIYTTEVEINWIDILRLLGRGEYFSNQLVQYCKDNGIIHEDIAPYSLQSNGVTIRKI